MELAIADSWRRAEQGLDGGMRKAVWEAVEKLLRGGPQMVGLHGLEDSEFLSFSVNRNARRVIVAREGETLVLLHVDEHDAAYRWAKRHRFVRTGRVVRLLEVREDGPEPSTAAASNASDALAKGISTPGPLGQVRDREFGRLGVTPRVAAVLRSVPDEDAVVELGMLMKPAVGEALVSLAAEPERLDEAVRVYEEVRTRGDAEVSLAEALRDPANQHKFWVPPPGEEALADALQAGLEAWRVFLHPSQRRVVKLDARGPGKTVVALHRARHLVEHVFPEDPRPVRGRVQTGYMC